jgi:ADP-dependent NAD(P)H-hydrate dehydratase / NAD(P)H-hydrate epimerase
MIIPNAEQIRLIDAATIQLQQIRSSDLMERAAKQISTYLLHQYSQLQIFHIYCGVGNNGGDGLCVARHLLQQGKKASVFIIGDPTKASPDFNINYQRLQHQFPNQVQWITDVIQVTEKPECVIDALFGSGLNKPVTGLAASVIEFINQQDALIVAIDLPSGLYADTPATGTIVKADITITFNYPKKVFFFPEANVYIGTWMIKDIGLVAPEKAKITSTDIYITEEEIIPYLPHRNHFSHKGTYGSSLIIGGGEGMEGAAFLSGMASLKTGAGLSTVSAFNNVYVHPELMFCEYTDIQKTINNKKINAVGIGPGLGNTEDSKQIFISLLQQVNFPIVVDADALNILSNDITLLSQLPKHSILTPHPKEFERLFGKYESWELLPKMMLDLAKEYQLIILYKRANTLIASPDGTLYINSTGNPGMATAGSGDVLTGMITGLLSQGLTPIQATITGVYLHGLAGDAASLAMGESAVTAGAMVECIGEVMKRLID